MEKKPLVSVVLPVYNECSFLQKAIDSIVGQSYSNIEIIIVNDGSTNSEVEKICFKYIDQIVYLRKENGGVASALNYAINVAKGEYIARMDGDDISNPERICKQVEFLEKHRDVDICGTNYEYINEEDLAISSSNLPLDDSEIKIHNIFQNSLCHPSIMFRREVFDNCLRYDENVKAEDYELWLRLEGKVKFANLKECLIKYRCNEHGVMKSHLEEIGLSAGIIAKEHLNSLMNNALENIGEYNFGNVSYVCNHIISILPFLQEQVYLYSTIIKWNDNSQYYNSLNLVKIINERWIKCLEIIGLRNFIINVKKSEFLEIRNLIYKSDNCKYFYRSISDIIKIHLDTLKEAKKYLIYSIGTRGQAIYSELNALKKQHKLHWEMVGFGDRKEEIDDLFSYPVLSINKIRNIKFDFIIIATHKYFEEIRDELIDGGVEQNKILDSNWIQWIKMYI